MSERVGGLVGRRRVVAVLAALCVVGVPGAVAVAAAASAETPPQVVDLGASTSASGATCRSFSVEVLQTPTDTTRQFVWGQRCHRGSLSGSKPAQVLVHGGGYNHLYWDSPYKPAQYSYVAQATLLGYTTINIDMLGAGNSNHPDPATLTMTMTTNGYVVHQIVTALKAGSMGPAFSEVILNGHSMGAGAVQIAAATWNDVEGVIVSGIGHNLEPNIQNTVGPLLYPAQFEPKFASDPDAVGYLTTLPGKRAEAFVLPGTIEPGVIEVEEGP